MKDLLFDLKSDLKITSEWLQHKKLILNIKKNSNAHIQYEYKNKKDKNLAPNKFKF